LIGKFVPKSNFSAIDNISFSLKNNQKTVQSGNSSLMLWQFDELIEYVSKYFTLKIGDVIFTGTPSGVAKVAPNDVLTGYVEEEEFFKIKIK
jgi:2-keto-4-pentenoate hydratase/2-oxohepta-3-ene-1,7-dioic acid hydratase in catechol pathway